METWLPAAGMCMNRTVVVAFALHSDPDADYAPDERHTKRRGHGHQG
jgi:hypothetical protein